MAETQINSFIKVVVSVSPLRVLRDAVFTVYRTDFQTYFLDFPFIRVAQTLVSTL